VPEEANSPSLLNLLRRDVLENMELHQEFAGALLKDSDRADNLLAKIPSVLPSFVASPS
jgi:hypothetical protein